MKKGLVYSLQPYYPFVAYFNQTINGSPSLGETIVDVVPTVDEFPVAPEWYWVDVDDSILGGMAAYDTATSTVIDLYPAKYYYTGNDPAYGPIGSEVFVAPASDPQPADTSIDPPLSPSAGSTLYWYDGGWVSSYFDPNVYNTLSAAKDYLNQQTYLVAAAAVNTQTSLYSTVQLVQGDLSTLPVLTYAGYTCASYQTYIDGEVSARVAEVNSATAIGQLFVFNPEELPTDPTAP